MYKEIISKRLRKARNMNGFTQEEVSRELKIPRSTLGKYETGDIEPSIERLGTLAEFYDVSIDWLFGLGTQGRTPNYYTEEQKKIL
jgi:transcriptional regulator with XRE-family HTH domain